MTVSNGQHGEYAALLRRAEHDYHHDPEFHAKVHTAVAALAADLRERTGQGMTDEDISLAKHAAAVALTVNAATTHFGRQLSQEDKT